MGIGWPSKRLGNGGSDSGQVGRVGQDGGVVGVSAAQGSKAARAAATALSTSSAVPAGTVAITCWVVGFSTALVSLPEGAVHWPPM